MKIRYAAAALACTALALAACSPDSEPNEVTTVGEAVVANGGSLPAPINSQRDNFLALLDGGNVRVPGGDSAAVSYAESACYTYDQGAIDGYPQQATFLGITSYLQDQGMTAYDAGWLTQAAATIFCPDYA